MTEINNKSTSSSEAQPLSTRLGASEIKKLIPHRYPFLLVDAVLTHEKGKIHTLKNISCNETYFQGHFPDNPIFPGVLIVEGMAQTAALCHALGEDATAITQGYLTEVKSARFRQRVVPGDVLHYCLELQKKRPPFFWYNGKASVGNSVVSSALLSIYMA